MACWKPAKYKPVINCTYFWQVFQVFLKFCIYRKTKIYTNIAAYGPAAGGLTRILFIWFVNENIDATYSRAVWPTTHCPSVCCCLVGRYVEFLCGDIFGMINKLLLLLWIYYSIFHINKNNPKILKLFCFFSLSIAILSNIHLSSSMWKFLRKLSLEMFYFISIQ